MTFKRQVPWEPAVAKWTIVGADADGAPDALFGWIESNLNGKWAYRDMSPQDFNAIFKRPHAGQFVFDIAFEREEDGHKLLLHLDEPQGKAH